MMFESIRVYVTILLTFISTVCFSQEESDFISKEVNLKFSYEKCVKLSSYEPKLIRLKNGRAKLSIYPSFSESLDIINPKIRPGYIGTTLSVDSVLNEESIKACSCKFKLTFEFDYEEISEYLHTFFFVRDSGVSQVFENLDFETMAK